MWTRHHKRRNTGRLIVPAIASLFLSYFAYHIFHGDYGIYAREKLVERVTYLDAELNGLRAAREKLEGRLALINDGSLEKDMLDEQARRALSLAQDNEIVIYRAAAPSD
ncbi:FtsB family cell division protein [Nitratireductor luteus]|uniref:FtsB family cell division protein n=1 Tax=Nitratireductor luteus TaxID=2976980 RepID=UPI00223FD821|nr:septum formation initiator family protein [Nitratireductor luteus]